ncbi:S53 family peptidase [Actinomadura verrucosospora]|uniref:Peptidase S8/S53 subtilisin kexin sedolisin n=1 Tax=Actinomadura verrucosospora TaxID=46165 RepID=A0A7D4ART3_ACTVE|nr:S53 family peptidase [Actinomadura verrucosospora]QKG25088.1 peptidase S8/S53 subtilisin kexin sedolisin [Actinomadura verrucosospora]
MTVLPPARVLRTILSVAASLSLAALLPVPPAAADGPPPGAVERACAWPPQHGRSSCLALRRTDVGVKAGLKGIVGDGYGPSELQDAYNLPSKANGKGQTVAIVDAYDDPNAESDLAAYRSFYGLPPCTTANGCFRKYNQRGETKNYPDPDRDWAGEIALDIDMVSAICPNCHIALVEADSNSNDDLAGAVSTAATTWLTGAKYISNSYGSPESSSSPDRNADYVAEGIAVTASAGDSGLEVEFPAADPYVVAVGGTSLLPAANARGWDEITWSGTGSGCSKYEQPRPPWQADPGCSHRMVTDVSAVADPETGVAVYDSYGATGGWGVYGGTSASSPIIASVYALAGPPASDGTDPAYSVYKHADQLNDIVAGRNSWDPCTPSYACQAGPGYDGPTGNGTPDGIGAFVATPGYPWWP